MLPILFIALSILAFVSGSSLTPEQQTSIRRILANPNTPPSLRIKTKQIVYEKYHVWAQHISKEYLKKRSCAELRPDLEQCVSSGLLAAIDRYDWKRFTSFPTYAKKYVLGAVLSGMDRLYQTRNEIDFVSPKQQWLFDKGMYCSTSKDTSSTLVSKDDIMRVLNPEERRLFEYMYGHVFDQETTKKTVGEICDLMAYANRETMRIKKTRMFHKIKNHRFDLR